MQKKKRRRWLVFVAALAGTPILVFVLLSLLQGYLYDDQSAGLRLKVAAVTMTCHRDKDVNRSRMIQWIDQAMREEPGTQLVFFGETVLGWYTTGADTEQYHRALAETIPGDTTSEISAAAVEHGVHISFGMTEEHEGRLYNAQILIDPSGEIIAVHRKFFLQGSGVFTPGGMPLTVVTLDGIKTAVLVCSDIQSPQVRAELQEQRPELLLGSLANPNDPDWFISEMIAKLVGSWIVTANRYGMEGDYFYDGQMIVADPLGRVRIKEKDSEQIVYYDLGFHRDRSSLQAFFGHYYRWGSLGTLLIRAAFRKLLG
jgi:predicted amidohydrolase